MFIEIPGFINLYDQTKWTPTRKPSTWSLVTSNYSLYLVKLGSEYHQKSKISKKINTFNYFQICVD